MSIVTVNTYTYSVTYVTDKLMASLRQIVSAIGLNTSKMLNQWVVLDRGIKTWLGKKELLKVELEIYNKKGEFVGAWDFKIDYSYQTDADGSMWIDTSAIRLSIQKNGLNVTDCDYRILLTTTSNATDVEGWGNATALDRAGYVRQGVGTTIGTNGIGTSLGYWRKS